MLSRTASSQVRRAFISRNATVTATTSTATSTCSFSSGPDVDIDNFKAEWKTYGNVSNHQPGKFVIQTFNKISPVGLKQFGDDMYSVKAGDGDVVKSVNPHALLLRSHKLKEEEVQYTVRAIARCGAGTNNIPVARMTELGIPVFNTPGANANAVKELVVCGMFLGSRKVIDGINHMKDLGSQGLAKERVEKDKSMFGGRELMGKTLAVIGLGHIGAATARDGAALGMDVVGYDPGLSVESALRLPDEIQLKESISSAVATADYISINIPYIKGEGGTHGIISSEIINQFKSDAVLLNFARGELVDSEAMKEFLDNGDGKYVSDFPDDLLWDHENAIVLPHLGASTEEAEDAAAAMAADTIKDYLEDGTIRNSVNFPATSLPDRTEGSIRFTVVNSNLPGMLAKITDVLAGSGLNITQQVNHSRGDIAYNVMDVDTSGHGDVISFKKVQEELTMMDGVLSSRILYGTPGTGYAKNLEGKYFV
jgi:D-3-phosphoglycerate dehydrogenase